MVAISCGWREKGRSGVGSKATIEVIVDGDFGWLGMADQG